MMTPRGSRQTRARQIWSPKGQALALAPPLPFLPPLPISTIKDFALILYLYVRDSFSTNLRLSL